MKILWFSWKDITHPQAGGAEVVTHNLAKRLAATGHEVILLTSRFKGSTQKQNKDGYKIIRVGNRLSVYYLAARYYRQNLRGWADLVVEEVNTIPFFTRFFVREPKILFFHQLCREIWFYQMFWPASVIGYALEPFYLRLLGDLPVVAVSNSTKMDLEKYGFNDVSIISEGINLKPIEHLNAVKKYNQPTVLSFGALRDMKRTAHHVEAFDIAKEQMPDLKLIVAGAVDGKYGKKVLDRIAASPFVHDIQFIKQPSTQQKIKLMQKSHLLIMSSVKEGWGLVVTEAASQGTPAVVYDVDGLRDSVKNGKTGLVVEPNVNDLAVGIVKSLQNKKSYQNTRHAAWQWSQQITFEKSYQDFLSALSSPRLKRQTLSLQQEAKE